MNVLEDWRATLALQEALRVGQWPEPLPDSRLYSGEPVFALGPARLDQLRGLQLAYGTSNPSTHAAAQHWADVAVGTAYLTPQRVMVQSTQEVSLGWLDLAALYGKHDGVYFEYGTPGASVVTFCLRLESPMWWTTMIRAVAWRQATDAEPPDWVRRRLRR